MGNVDNGGIKKFRARPVVIEALLWTGVNIAEVAAFVGDANLRDVRELPTEGQEDGALALWNEKERCPVRCPAGHWIIRGIAGEFYPCAPDVLALKYEPVDVATTGG